jgi:hypothetical protein
MRIACTVAIVVASLLVAPARGMPVHSHHGSKGLEPEWLRQSREQFLAPDRRQYSIAIKCPECLWQRPHDV